MAQALSEKEATTLLETLETRFNENMERHPNMNWHNIAQKLETLPTTLWSLAQMEATGGEPDIVGDDYIFVDCAPESPKGRRSICYDRTALEGRKKNPPKNDAQTIASEMGVELLTEAEYYTLQDYGEFDLKSSSWVQSPTDIRGLGGAIFCERRYDTIFTYHNSAESYYSARGFRSKLRF